MSRLTVARQGQTCSIVVRYPKDLGADAYFFGKAAKAAGLTDA
jgi:hypothetical protein